MFPPQTPVLRIVFPIVTVPPLEMPPPNSAALPLSVLMVIVSVPVLEMPAPDGRIRGPTITADCAVAHCQRARFVVDAAAASAAVGGIGPVTGNSAVGESQRPAAVVDAATANAGVTSADCAAIDHQCSVIVVNAATA